MLACDVDNKSITHKEVLNNEKRYTYIIRLDDVVSGVCEKPTRTSAPTEKKKKIIAARCGGAETTGANQKNRVLGGKDSLESSSFARRDLLYRYTHANSYMM